MWLACRCSLGCFKIYKGKFFFFLYEFVKAFHSCSWKFASFKFLVKGFQWFYASLVYSSYSLLCSFFCVLWCVWCLCTGWWRLVWIYASLVKGVRLFFLFVLVGCFAFVPLDFWKSHNCDLYAHIKKVFLQVFCVSKLYGKKVFVLDVHNVRCLSILLSCFDIW